MVGSTTSATRSRPPSTPTTARSGSTAGMPKTRCSRHGRRPFPARCVPSEMSAELMSHVRYPQDLFKGAAATAHPLPRDRRRVVLHRPGTSGACPRDPTHANGTRGTNRPITSRWPCPGSRRRPSPDDDLHPDRFRSRSCGIPRRRCGRWDASRRTERGTTGRCVCSNFPGPRPSTARVRSRTRSRCRPSGPRVRASHSTSVSSSRRIGSPARPDLREPPHLAGRWRTALRPAALRQASKEGGSFPQIKATVAVFGKKVAWGETLDQALDGLFGARVRGRRQAMPGRCRGGRHRPVAARRRPLVTSRPRSPRSRAGVCRGREALKAGDFTAYGEAQKRLEAATFGRAPRLPSRLRGCVCHAQSEPDVVKAPIWWGVRSHVTSLNRAAARLFTRRGVEQLGSSPGHNPEVAGSNLPC